MRVSGKRMPPRWIFAAGTLFGALAVFAPIASSSTSGSKADASKPRRHVSAAADPSAAARDLQVSLEAREPASVRPAPTASRRTKPHPPNAANQTARHSELDLQLD